MTTMKFRLEFHIDIDAPSAEKADALGDLISTQIAKTVEDHGEASVLPMVEPFQYHEGQPVGLWGTAICGLDEESAADVAAIAVDY
jgi:hypothetical protein